MTDISASGLDRLDKLNLEAKADKAMVSELSRSFDESTGASWFWAFLFGPIYFAAHGFWGRAVIVLLLNIVVIGFFVAPFLAYPAWRKRAEQRAQNMVDVDKFRRA